MRRWFHGYTLTAFAAFMAVSPALAAPAPHSSTTLAAPAAAAAAGQLNPQRRSVLMAQAPFAETWNAAVLSVNSQAMGLQTSRARQNSPVRMAIAGAAVGAIVGAIAGDPLTDAAIGGAVGFGVAFVMRH